MKRFFFLAFFFCICLTASPAAAASQMPFPIIVYTGVLHSEKTGNDILARMTMIDTSTGGIQTYAATVTLFVGDEFSNEYSTAYYDSVFIAPRSREILLQRSDAVVSRRLPTIRLRFTEDSFRSSGRFITPQGGDVGQIDFVLGWVPPNDRPYRFISSLAGTYDAQCPYGTVELRSLHIVASRIFSDITSHDGLPGSIHYIANGFCSGPAYTGNGNCAHATSGLFNFYEDIVVFNRGGVACRRVNGKDLECNLLGTVAALKPNICTFLKTDVQQSEPRKPSDVIRIPVAPILWNADKSMDPVLEKIRCEDLNGRRRGILTHLRDGRRQLLTLRIDAFSAMDDSGQEECLLIGDASLEFPNKEVLNFTLPARRFNPSVQTITLMSEVSSDAGITIDVQATSSIHGTREVDGYWFSRLFGVVGIIKFSDENGGMVNLNAPTDLLVYGANGRYNCSPKTMSLVLFAATSSNSRIVSWDPFNQLKYSGSVAGFNAENPSIFPLPGLTTPILESSFDYFTNSLVLDGAATYTGYVDSKGLHIWGGPSRRYIKNVSLDEQICIRQPEDVQ